MTDETLAAPAPEAEEAVSSEAPAVEEQTEDQLLSEAYDRIGTPEEETPQDDAPEKPEEEEAADGGEDTEEAEKPAEEVDLPLDLPKSLKDKWPELPEETRSAITTAHREMANKVAMFGKEAAGLRPIKESLIQAIEANPEIANMRPEDVAAELPNLVRVGQQLKNDPMAGVLQLAQNFGITEHLAHYFSGGQANAAMERENQQLRQEIQQLKQYASPDFIERKFEEMSTRQQALSSVQEFATQAEHWSEVEPYLPDFINAAMRVMGDEAPTRDVLESAYNMAVSQLMPGKAKAKGAVQDASPQPDPAKAQKAREASSVNIAGKPSGKSRPQTEDELLNAVWEKRQRAS